MSISIVVEIAIALAFVYYVVGLIVSFFVSQITTAFEMKGKNLYKLLEESVTVQSPASTSNGRQRGSGKAFSPRSDHLS